MIKRGKIILTRNKTDGTSHQSDEDKHKMQLEVENISRKNNIIIVQKLNTGDHFRTLKKSYLQYK